MTDEPLPVGTPVDVTLKGKVVATVPGTNGGWLYQIEGTDGRKRWVPGYNVEPVQDPSHPPVEK